MSDSVSLPDPYRLTTSSQTAGAPGTMTVSASREFSISVPACPRSRRRSRVSAAGERPPLRAL